MSAYIRPLIASFGTAYSGQSSPVANVGYSVVDEGGTTQIARTSTGVAEDGATGTYLASPQLDTSWGEGYVRWDIMGQAGIVAYDRLPVAGSVRAPVILGSADEAKLSQLDTAVSTRLATSAYLAPNNAGIAALETTLAALLLALPLPAIQTPSTQVTNTAMVLEAVVPGNDYAIDHYITLPLGMTILEALLGFKLAHSDNKTMTLIPVKLITTAPLDGVGQILDPGSLISGFWVCHVHFDLQAVETGQLVSDYHQPDGTLGYPYFLDLTTTMGGSYTAEIGTLPTLSGGKDG